MTKTCSACRHENPERAVFCGECGKPLPASAPIPAAPAAAEAQPIALPEFKNTAQLQVPAAQPANVPLVTTPEGIPPAPDYLTWLGVGSLLFGPGFAGLNYALVSPGVTRLKDLGGGPGSTSVLQGMIWFSVFVGGLCTLAGVGFLLKQHWGRWAAYVYAVAALLGIGVAFVGTAVCQGLFEMEMLDHPSPYGYQVRLLTGLSPLFTLAFAALQVGLLLVSPRARAWAKRKWPAVYVPASGANAAAGGLAASGEMVYKPPPQLSNLALMTLVLSLTPFMLLPQIASLVTGVMALRKIKRSAGALTGRGLAIGGMCISTCMLTCIGGIIGVALVFIAMDANGGVRSPFVSRLEKAHELSASGQSVSQVVFSPSDDRVAALAGGEFHLWDTQTGLKISQRACPAALLTFSRDGDRLLAVQATNPPSLVSFDPRTGAELSLAETTEPANSVRELSLSRDEPRLLCGYVQSESAGESANSIVVWELESDRELSRFALPANADGIRDYVDRVLISPDGKTVLALAGGKLFVCDAATGVIRHEHQDVYTSGAVQFMPDGRSAAGCNPKSESMGSSENAVLNLATGTKAFDLPAHRWGRACLAFSSDGKWGVSGGRTASDAGYMVINGGAGAYGHEVQVWSTATRQDEVEFLDHSARVNCVAFSNDSKRVAAGYADGTIMLFNFKP